LYDPRGKVERTEQRLALRSKTNSFCERNRKERNLQKQGGQDSGPQSLKEGGGKGKSDREGVSKHREGGEAGFHCPGWEKRSGRKLLKCGAIKIEKEGEEKSGKTPPTNMRRKKKTKREVGGGGGAGGKKDGKNKGGGEGKKKGAERTETENGFSSLA